MVWQEESQIILMITHLEEKGRVIFWENSKTYYLTSLINNHTYFQSLNVINIGLSQMNKTILMIQSYTTIYTLNL